MVYVFLLIDKGASKKTTVAEASARRSVFQWAKKGGVYKLNREYKIQDSTLVKR